MAKEPPVLDGEIAYLLDPETLENHIRNKVIKRQSHPTLPLAILNYTQKCQFENLWDSVTMRCRGLIYNYETGNIVAVPFAKFFNYDTGDREETFPENLPTFESEITKKMDGSLGIFWRYGKEWGVATRGSFVSEQAKWATKWLEDRGSILIKHLPDQTPLFEIIYPENQVVVKYEQSGLTLIGCIHNKTGADFRLHRLLTGTSPKRIWEYLKDGLPLEELSKDVPEHFREWIKDWVGKLSAECVSIEEESKKIFANKPILNTRKDFALWIQTSSGSRGFYAPILFKIYDNQPYKQLIWKMVKPLTEGIGTFKSVDE